MSGKAPSVIDRIRAEIAKREALDAETESLIADLSLQLVSDPTNKDLQQQLTVLDDERSANAKQLAHLKVAKREAEKRATQAGKKDRLALLQAAAKRINDRRPEQRKAIQLLINAVRDAGAALAKLDVLASDNRGDVWAICQNSGDADRAIETQAEVLIPIANAHRSAGEVIRELYRSGLGRVGLPLHPFVDILPSGKDGRSVDEAFAKDQKDLDVLLTSLLDKCARKLSAE